MTIALARALYFEIVLSSMNTEPYREFFLAIKTIAEIYVSYTVYISRGLLKLIMRPDYFLNVKNLRNSCEIGEAFIHTESPAD